MSWDNGTGGDVSFERQAVGQVPFAYEAVSGERWAPGIETPGSRSTGETRRRAASTPTVGPPAPPRRVPEKALRNRRLYLKACLDELQRVRTNKEDLVLTDNALADAKGHLESLWELVEGDSAAEAFEEMINVLQIAFSVESPADLSVRQLDAIESVLEKMHDDPDVDDQTANDLTEQLIRGGIDVFREIG